MLLIERSFLTEIWIDVCEGRFNYMTASLFRKIETFNHLIVFSNVKYIVMELVQNMEEAIRALSQSRGGLVLGLYAKRGAKRSFGPHHPRQLCSGYPLPHRAKLLLDCCETCCNGIRHFVNLSEGGNLVL